MATTSTVNYTPTISGNGITWSQVATTLYDTSGTIHRITVFVGKTGESPSAGGITVGQGGNNTVALHVVVDEDDGAVDISGTALQAVVQSKTGSVDASGASESIVLDGAITPGNASYGAFGHLANESTTQGNEYTLLGDGGVATPSCALATEYKSAGSQTVDASWTTSSTKGGVALEIKATVVGGGVVHPIFANDDIHSVLFGGQVVR